MTETEALEAFGSDLNTVKQVFVEGSSEFNKSYVFLVYRAACNGVSMETSKVLIKKVPREYFQNVMPTQMAEDEVFASVACKLAERFRAANIVEPPTYAAPNHLILKRAHA